MGCARRRAAGEPLGRILGYRDFWKDRFHLSKDTLEPRPDTETLIESVWKVLEVIRRKQFWILGRVVDVFFLSLLNFPRQRDWNWFIHWGLPNRQFKYEAPWFSDRCTILNGSWCEPLDKWAKFDLIVSNPPIFQVKISRSTKRGQESWPYFLLWTRRRRSDPYRICCQI